MVSALERQLQTQVKQVATLTDEQHIHVKQIADLRHQNQSLVQAHEAQKQQLAKLNAKRMEDDRWQQE